MDFIDKIRKKYVIFIIKFFGAFGFDVFHLSERIINKNSEVFFGRFTTKNNNSLMNDPDLVKDILYKNFSGKVEDGFIDFLVTTYLLRINGQRDETFSNNSKIHLNNLFAFNRLKPKEFYLISKYFSKLGYFELSNEIVKYVEGFFIENDYNSIYSLFQKIKILLHYKSEELVPYLSRLNLINHFNLFYHLDVFLNKLDDNKISHNNQLYVLGPLREEENLFSYKDKKIALIKPNPNEIELLNELNYSKCYLYSYSPISNILLTGDSVINVIDYHSKKNGQLVEKMNYYSQFLLINGYPQHLQRVLIHQLYETQNKYFSLDFVSFYLSDIQYSNNYLYPSKPISAKSNSEIQHFIWWNGWHDLIANFKFCKLLYEKGLLINNSDLVENIIRMDVDDYVYEMEKFYSFY